MTCGFTVHTRRIIRSKPHCLEYKFTSPSLRFVSVSTDVVLDDLRYYFFCCFDSDTRTSSIHELRHNLQCLSNYLFIRFPYTSFLVMDTFDLYIVAFLGGRIPSQTGKIPLEDVCVTGM